MPRTSNGPRYYKSKHAWFANLDGERILLARGQKKATEEEANEKYQAEVDARKAETVGDRNKVWMVLNAYIRHLKTREEPKAAPNTIKLAKKYLGSFSAMHGCQATISCPVPRQLEIPLPLLHSERPATITFPVRPCDWHCLGEGLSAIVPLAG